MLYIFYDMVVKEHSEWMDRLTFLAQLFLHCNIALQSD